MEADEKKEENRGEKKGDVGEDPSANHILQQERFVRARLRPTQGGHHHEQFQEEYEHLPSIFQGPKFKNNIYSCSFIFL